MPFPLPRDLHKPGTAPRSPATPALEGGLSTTGPLGKPTALVGLNVDRGFHVDPLVLHQT